LLSIPECEQLIFKDLYTIFLFVLIVKVYLKANASEEKIELQSDLVYNIWVKEPRIKGKANKAMLKVLKNKFGKHVSLISGAISNLKIVKVDEE